MTMDRVAEPKALEYEKASLYLALSYNSSAAEVFEQLSVSDFHNPVFAEIWKAGQAVYRESERVSFLSVEQRLEEMGFGLDKPLSQVLEFNKDTVPRKRDTKSIVSRLVRMWALRELEEIGTEAVREVRRPEGPGLEILMEKIVDRTFEVESRVYDQIEGGTDRKLYSGSSYVARRKKGLARKAIARKVGTGWPEIDKYLTYGFGSGKQTILAGRPGIGKSAVKSNLIKSLCEREFGILSITPEMGVEDDGERLDALVAKIPLKELGQYRHWAPADPRRQDLDEAIRTQSEWKLFTYAHRKVSVATIASQLNKLRRAGEKIDVVFIDLFDRLQDTQVVEHKNYKVGQVLNDFALLAQEYQTHFVHVVQIHRLGRQASAQRYKPTMEDLKGSGSFEEFADLILLLWREGYYNKGVVDDRIEICLAKQRGGVGGDHMWLPFLLQKELMFVGSLMEGEDESTPSGSTGNGTDFEPVEDEGSIW